MLNARQDITHEQCAASGQRGWLLLWYLRK